MPAQTLMEKVAQGVAIKAYKPLNDKLKEVNKKISGNETGDISTLKTSNKDNLISALNEVKDQATDTVKKGEVYSKSEIGDLSTIDFSKLLEDEINKVA